MTNLNNPLTRAQPSAPSSTLTVPASMEEFSPGQNSSDLGTDLQRLQRNVSGPVNALLDNANGLGAPISIAIPATSLTASMNAYVYYVPLIQTTAVTGLVVDAIGSLTGTGTIALGQIVCPITTRLTLTRPAIAPKVTGTLSVQASTSASWAFTGTVYVTIYLRAL